MAQWFDIGDMARLSVTFTDADGAGADPTAVALTVKDPAGTETTPGTTNDTVGSYYADVALSASGTWHWRWEGTGANAAATEGTVSVRVSNF